MARVSTTLANAVLNALLNATSFSLAGDPYVSLHTGDPGTTGANEVTGGTYTRQQVPFNAAASGSAKNTAAISYTLMPTATVTHIGIWSAVSAGTYYIGGALAASIGVSSGNTLSLTAEHITVALS